MKQKIGIIVQRYGAEVNGGAEVHARMIAEKLSSLYDVTVLTSQAIDYVSWNPEYAEGTTELNGIRIIRFANRPRDHQNQRYYLRKLRYRHLPQKIYRFLGSPRWWLKFFPDVELNEEDGYSWLEAQGPAMPALLPYLKQQENEFAAFIFFTALYYPSAMGVLTVPGKSILVPTMHDELAMRFPIYKKIMAAPKWILYNTRWEMEFSEKFFSLNKDRKRVVGVGIDRIKEAIAPDNSVLQRFNISSPYIIYVGRIDEVKGCDRLIDYFLKYISQHPIDLKLVLVGKAVMQLPSHPSIIHTGFVTDEEKEQLMLQALALANPSPFESMSLVLLESFACAVPVIANGNTDVMKDHINDSGGGWTFYNEDDFIKALNELQSEGIRKEKGEKGYEYVKKNYSWEKVMAQFEEAITDVERGN